MFGSSVHSSTEEVVGPIGYVVGADRESILAACADLDRRRAALVGALGEFDASCEYAVDGALNLQSWLVHHAGLDPLEARRLVVMAQRLRQLPGTAAGFTDGSLSSGQVQAIVSHVSVSAVGQFADHEDELLGSLAGLSVRHTNRAMDHWKKCHDAVHPKPVPEVRNELFVDQTGDGTWAVAGTLHDGIGVVVHTALTVAQHRYSKDDERSPAMRRGDALGEVCQFFLDHHVSPPKRRHRPHLNVVVRAETLSGSEPGPIELSDRYHVQLSRETLDWLACDANVHRIILGPDREILDYGHAHQMIPQPLWHALVLRDRHCRFPSCDRPADWCHGHHIKPWAQHGPTKHENLVLMCAYHHHLIHRKRWHLKLQPDNTLILQSPDGRTHETRPPP